MSDECVMSVRDECVMSVRDECDEYYRLFPIVLALLAAARRVHAWFMGDWRFGWV